MIKEKDKLFSLDTENLTYALRVGKFGHIEHIYFGRKTEVNDKTSELKHNLGLGSTVSYDESEPNYSLDVALLEYSGIGKGDYRHTPLELKMPDGTFTTDFVYESHKVYDGTPTLGELPSAIGEGQSLEITLADKKYPKIKLVLIYTAFADCDCICRTVKLINGDSGQITIRKIASLCMDIAPLDCNLITLDGGWAKEAHSHARPVECGVYVNDSTTGSSSNRHNPAFMLAAKSATDELGDVIGVNLIYSGNHYSAVEKSNHGCIRIMTGINPFCFEWTLKSGETFIAPQAVITKSITGFNGLSSNMHAFVSEHIVRGEFKDKERPILFNHWEAFMFDFNKRKILALASRAKKLGAELFVLDDGWFGNRNSDTAGLGDYKVNTKKLKGGLNALAKCVNKKGMKFGLWFEPECINYDSDLYRAHSDWAIQIEGRTPSLGRHQLVLDLTQKAVRDYIVENVNNTIKSANIEYVKWDYNRHISDAFGRGVSEQGRFYHAYILGLYDILNRITTANPHVLFESCSSGGNRFDLGALCFTPQIWGSDDTDPIERLKIQRGYMYFYPQSTIGAHVSQAPHQQTLRNTSISTRFNVAAFGAFGYELDLSELTKFDLNEIKSQIEFYKKHRKTFQFGKFRAGQVTRDNRVSWQVIGSDEAIAVEYQLATCASPSFDVLKVPMPSGKYTVDTRLQHIKISTFGSLVKHVLPVHIKPEGVIMSLAGQRYMFKNSVEHYEASGEELTEGIPLNMQFSGGYYDKETRILGDFGSQLYVIKKVD